MRLNISWRGVALSVGMAAVLCGCGGSGTTGGAAAAAAGSTTNTATVTGVSMPSSVSVVTAKNAN
jgi:hypothetical protein